MITFFKNLKHAFITMPQLLIELMSKNQKPRKLNQAYEHKLDEIKGGYLLEGREDEYEELCAFIYNSKARYS